MLEKVEWGKFKLEKLFNKLKVNSLKYKTSDLPEKKEGIFNLPALTAGIQNQGLNNFVPREEATILKNVISISANGANTGATFYQNNEFTVLQDAYVIDYVYTDDKLNNFHYLFLTSAISKTIFANYEWTNKAGWEKIKHEYIQLPVKNGEIDFDFMEQFIEKLEKQKIEKLNNYLEVTGLKDYNLTKEEKEVLEDFESRKVEWGEFRMGDLFERLSTKKLPFKASELLTERTSEYNLPCLTSSFKNQGLNYFVPKGDLTILKDVISIPSNSDVYRAYFQSQDFTVLSDAYVINWINNKLLRNSKHGLFSVTSINKVTDLKIYSYKNKLGGWNVVKDKNISLPSKNNEPDYELMETLISAIQKLVIKDVVNYTDGKIN